MGYPWVIKKEPIMVPCGRSSPYLYTSFLEGAGGDLLPGFAGPGARLMVMDLDGPERDRRRRSGSARTSTHLMVYEYLQIVRLGYA